MKWLPVLSFGTIQDEAAGRYKLTALFLVLCVFVTSVVVTNVIGVKIMTLFGLSFTAGVITYASSFLATDLISEIWGRRTANYAVLLGFLCNLVLLAFVYLAVVSPPAPFWVQNQPAYESVLGGVPRLIGASMVAYLVSQFHDVWAFHLWRRVTKGRHLWLRNNLSTFTSQTIDTVIFILLAFWGQFSAPAMLSLMFGQFAVKWVLAAIDTAFIYLFVNLVLKEPVPGAHPVYD